MAPPFKVPYAYFRHDAEIYLPANRPGWSDDDIKNTISALWAANNRVRMHYAGSKNQNPGPGIAPVQNEIPAVAYTGAEADTARRTKQLPARAAAPPPLPLPVPPPPHPSPPPPPPPGTSTYVDTMPHNFWPQLPWMAELNIDPLDARIFNPSADRVRNDWLIGNPGKDPIETRWRGVKFLGAGGFGVAGLWLELDEDHNVINRMVVKDVQRRASAWRDPQNWRNRLPREIRIHELIEERRNDEPGCQYLVQYHGYRLLMTQRRYRIYLEYYDASNLYNAMTHHFHDQTDIPLPEKFIWYIAKALASACLVLQQGTTSDEALEAWKPITHLDMHMGNIFLGFQKRKRGDSESKDGEVGDYESGERRDKKQKTATNTEQWTNADWQELPIRPVLADFGLSFYSVDNDGCPISDNPRDYLCGSGQTRYAPEHQWQPESPLISLGEKTDVWGIGSILWYLVTQRYLRDGPVREDIFPGQTMVDQQPYHDEFDASELARRNEQKVNDENYYQISQHSCKENRLRHNNTTVLNGDVFTKSDMRSDELTQLARDCLNWHQEERSTLQDILEQANRSLSEAGTKDLLRDWEDFQLSLPNHKEKFKIGESVKTIPDDDDEFDID